MKDGGRLPTEAVSLELWPDVFHEIPKGSLGERQTTSEKHSLAKISEAAGVRWGYVS